MPVKMLNFSFQVPMTTLLGLVATGSVALKIDAMGHEKPARKPKGAQALPAPSDIKLLEGPNTGKKKKRKAKHPTAADGKTRGVDSAGKPMKAGDLVLFTLARAPKYTSPLADLIPLVTGLGLGHSTASVQLNYLHKQHFVRRVDKGVYQLTAAGIKEAQRRAEQRKSNNAE